MSATTQADACTAGGVAPAATTVGFVVISAPPTGACSAAVAVSGCATTKAVVAQAVRSKRIGGSLDAQKGNRHLVPRQETFGTSSGAPDARWLRCRRREMLRIALLLRLASERLDHR
ncbi:hypothetical protein GCM10029976_044590 [Kribbella albertanoniae]